MHPLLDVDAGPLAGHLSDRAVTALNPALTDAIARVSASGRQLTIITPGHVRMTHALHELIATGAVRWGIHAHDGSYFDASSGAPFDLDSAGDGPSPAAVTTPHPQWHAGDVDPSDLANVLTCRVTLEHRASGRLILDSVEVLCRTTTGSTLHGWGSSEPVAQHWDAGAMTAFARRRSPHPVRLVVIGDAVAATVTVTRTSSGVREDIVLAAAGIDDPTRVAADALAELAERRPASFGIAHVRQARADLTVPAEPRPMPRPVAVLLGARACRRIGTDVLDGAPLADVRLAGATNAPAMVWPVTGDVESAWQHLAAFVEHVGREVTDDGDETALDDLLAHRPDTDGATWPQPRT